MPPSPHTPSTPPGPSAGPGEGAAFRAALPWLLFTTLLFLVNFTARTLFAPLMVDIEQELGLTHTEAGVVFLWIALGFSISMLLSGAVNSRLTHRRTITLSAMILGASMATAGLAPNFALLQGAVFVMGLGGGLYLPSGVAAMTSLVEPHDYGKALSLHELAPNTAFILMPLLAGLLLPTCSWRTILTAAGALCLTAGAGYGLFGRGGASHGAPLQPHVLREILRRGDFWAYAALFVLAVGVSIGPFSVLPLFLVNDHGLSPERANQLLGLSRLPCPLLAFSAGFIIDRIGPVRTIAAGLALAGAATVLLGLATGGWLTAAVLIQPVLTVTFFPAALTAMSHAFPGAQRPMSVALIVPLGILAGNGLLPAALGRLGDTVGFGPGFVLLGALQFAGLALLPRLRGARGR
ncbi:MAG: MFS transporter [Desulfovibrionaceae bacterium]|jgi:NNP family nitrate/nitrite transporter-like MFS transporter|nr:MFS transporter [Desulfovibrionaceae bacterium]